MSRTKVVIAGLTFFFVLLIAPQAGAQAPRDSSKTIEEAFTHVFADRSQALEDLLKRGLNPEAKDDLGRSLLYYAVSADRYHAAKILIKYGANVNGRCSPRDEQSSGPEPVLHAAVRNLSTRGLKALLEADGVELDIRDDRGRTALIRLAAVMSPAFSGAESRYLSYDETLTRSKTVASMLATAGADLNAEDQEGNTPLYGAAFFQPELFEYLVRRGANLNGHDSIGRSLLERLIAERSSEEACLAVKTGADLMLKSSLGELPRDQAQKAFSDLRNEFDRLKVDLDRARSLPAGSMKKTKTQALERELSRIDEEISEAEAIVRCIEDIL